MFLRMEHAQKSSGDLLKIQGLLICRFEWGLRFHISNKLPGDAEADELRSSL